MLASSEARAKMYAEQKEGSHELTVNTPAGGSERASMKDATLWRRDSRYSLPMGRRDRGCATAYPKIEARTNAYRDQLDAAKKVTLVRARHR
jgi:hypothetical protein